MQFNWLLCLLKLSIPCGGRFYQTLNHTLECSRFAYVCNDSGNRFLNDQANFEIIWCCRKQLWDISKYIYVLVQETRNFISNALELQFSCTNTLIWGLKVIVEKCTNRPHPISSSSVAANCKNLKKVCFQIRPPKPQGKSYHDDVIKWKYFRVTGPLCGEFTGRRWIPLTKVSDALLWCFLWSVPE